MRAPFNGAGTVVCFDFVSKQKMRQKISLTHNALHNWPVSGNLHANAKIATIAKQFTFIECLVKSDQDLSNMTLLEKS